MSDDKRLERLENRVGDLISIVGKTNRLVSEMDTKLDTLTQSLHRIEPRLNVIERLVSP
jgi:uncharacterized coiled-coil protein SlyX